MMNEKIETYNLFIDGMDCQDEVSIVEKTLRSITSVRSFKIYITTQRVKVVCDSSLISAQQVIRCIAKAGFKASFVEEKATKTAWWKEKRILALFGCGGFTLTAFVLEKAGWEGLITIILHSIGIVIGGYYPAKMAFSALKTLTLNIRTLMVTGAL